MSSSRNWPCEAYGLSGLDHGLLCFFGAARVCADLEQCHSELAVERRRVFDRIHQLAASGDTVMQDLADEFTDPEQLLGGRLDPE